jgi:hypothetical protein
MVAIAKLEINASSIEKLATMYMHAKVVFKVQMKIEEYRL